MEHKLVFPTYEEMHEKAVKLGHLIKSKNINFDKMVVVSRGGFVPAAVVAYTLGIPVSYTHLTLPTKRIV